MKTIPVFDFNNLTGAVSSDFFLKSFGVGKEPITKKDLYQVIKVKNITNRNQLLLTINGLNHQVFDYNPVTRLVTFNCPLNIGENVIFLESSRDW